MTIFSNSSTFNESYNLMLLPLLVIFCLWQASLIVFWVSMDQPKEVKFYGFMFATTILWLFAKLLGISPW